MAANTSFVGAIRETFGMKPGQTKLGELGAEIKELTDQDRVDLGAGFVKAGSLTQEAYEAYLAKRGIEGLTPQGGY